MSTAPARGRGLQGVGEPDEAQLCEKDEPDGQHALDSDTEPVEARIRTKKAVYPLAGVPWRWARWRCVDSDRGPCLSDAHRRLLIAASPPCVAWIALTQSGMDSLFASCDFATAASSLDLPIAYYISLQYSMSI